jgi:arginine deiminase
MNRRTFLAALSSAAFAEVKTDTGKLLKVIVHRPGAEIRRSLGVNGSYLSEEAAEQHASFVRLLEGSGAQVLYADQLIDEAIAAARPGGHLRAWLRARVPAIASREATVTARMLLGAVDETVSRTNPEGLFEPLIEPHGSIIWTRDSVVATPRGIVMCNFLNEGRAIESFLMRFAFDWSPTLKKYPVVFDAVEEGLTLEGGDLMVIDSSTLMVGIGNRTNPAIAKRLAQKLNMDVLAVQMPTGGSAKRWNDPDTRTPVHSAFLHLDTICCFADSKTAVTLPYLLEEKFTGKDPLTRILEGMAKRPNVREADQEKMIRALESFGRVSRFKAGSGDLDASVKGLKLVDYLKAQGVKVIFVGGQPPADPASPAAFQHMSEKVIREVRNQAANFVAVAPGKVLSYSGNPLTQRAMEASGIQVQTFKATDIVKNNGGPHCLTMPLERAE